MNTIKKGLKRAAYEFGVPLSEVRDVIQELIAYVTDMIKKEQDNTPQTSNKRFNLMHLLLGRFCI